MRFPCLLAFVVLSAAACGNRARDETAAPFERRGAAQDGWVTVDGVDFPPSMAQAPAKVQEAYVFAAKHPEVLRYMPCYCGCQNESPPHTSNYDCFVDQIDHNGERPRVEIDPMGFG